MPTPVAHRTGAFAAFIALLLAVLPQPARAVFDNTNPRGTFAGTHNYVVTGNTLRSQSNNGNACAVSASSTASVSGIPAGSTIMAAYLYWGGSGPAADPSVTFGAVGNTAAIAPDQSFSDNFSVAGSYDMDYFGGFKDVTAQVAGNGTYQFGDLFVATTDNYNGNGLADYCAPQAVVAGWALVVVYSNPAEAYRYTRVYDGLRYFRGSSVTTTQSGFRVPDLLDGKVTVVTWEGDPDATSSFDLDGFSEALSFDGYPLSNAGCDAANNLYNSTIGNMGLGCSTTSYGVDIDTYDVTSFLYEGQTGASLQYSSGNDLVFLTAQVISTTNTPVADLGISKAHTGNFTAGQNGSFDIVVHNYGPEIATGTATVTDTLPTGMSYVSAAGTGWTCGAVGQVVTCNNSAPSIAIGADLPTLTLTVAVDGSAAASVDNIAEVSHPMFDGTGGNQSVTDTVAILRSDLSSSSKSVVDLDGGDAEVGDVLRYTITLDETGGQGIAASGVEVVDDLPADLGGLSIVSIPSGATDLSVGSGGANGTGQVKVTGITVPAGGSATIVFDATIQGTADPGDFITNTATVANGSGPGATPSVQTEVAASQAPVSGNKLLYFEPGGVLDRTPQAGSSTIVVPEAGSTTFTLNGTLARDLVLVGGSDLVVTLVTRRSGGNSTRNVFVQLLKNGVQVGVDSNTQSFSNTAWTARTFTIAIPPGAETWLDGTPLAIRVVNDSSGSNNRTMDINTVNGVDRSVAALDASTVVNVDSVSLHTAAYPSAATKATWEPGDTVYIRADIGDPFGGYDVTSATLTLTDADGTPILSGTPMPAQTNPANDGATPNRIFEYAYTLGATPDFGTWTAAVTGNEGTEGISHTRNRTFTVAPKALEVVKSHAGDFTAGASASYTLLVNNTGTATVTGTTTVKDTLATGLAFVSGTGTGWSCGAAGQVVTCTSSASVPASTSMAPITLVVAVAGNLGSSVANQASVGNSTIAGGFQKPGNTDTAVVLHPDLSTSTKTVVDQNGGDSNPGDTLRYTITLVESAGVAANGASVSDTLQAGLEGLTGLHASSTCGGTASVSGGTLSVTAINVAAGGSCTLVFDVSISPYAAVGFSIDNSATIANPNGPGAVAAAPTVTVSASQQAVSGNKILYVYANNTLSRTPQGAAATINIGEASSQDFSLGAVAAPLSFTTGQPITIELWLQRPGAESNNRDVHVQLFKNGAAQIGGNSNTVTINNGTLARQTFTITAPTLGNAGNLVAGDTLTLRVVNSSSGFGTRSLDLLQYSGGTGSTITFATSTVVHVDSVTAYSAAYPSTSQAASYGQGETVYIRAQASDPFGYADVSGGAIAIKDADGTTIANATLLNGTHTVGTPSGATRTYEYAFNIPAGADVGGWTASITANEGSEGTVSHTGNGGFNVGGKVTLLASWGVGANAGDAVGLSISGGSSAVAGASTAPSTLTPATANGATGGTITLAQAFTTGSAGSYTITLACVRDTDGTTVSTSGTGLSRTITMPPASVTCTWSNGKTVPLTIVKLSLVRSDPVSGTTNPKAVPGAVVEYQIIVTNPATTPADADSIVIKDAVPAHADLRVVDIGAPGSGPVLFTDGSPSSGLAYTFTSLSSTTDDVDFSSDNGASWNYTPVPDGNGVDAAVTDLRINPKNAFNDGNAQFTVSLHVRIE